MDPDNLDPRFTLWHRNVKDEYKSLSNEEIKADVKSKSLPGAVLMSHVSGDFNISNVIRSANSFGIVDVFYYGKKKFDKRGAVGTYHYINVVHLASMNEVIALKDKYKFIGMENNRADTVALHKHNWDPNSLIIIGEEGTGIAPEILNLLDQTVEIPSIGSVRSLNAGSAAAIAFYDYFCKFKS